MQDTEQSKTERRWELISKQIFGQLSAEEQTELEKLDAEQQRAYLYCNSKGSYIPEEEFLKSDF